VERERAHAYTTARPELLRILPTTPGPILDVGCSTGVVGAAIKAARPRETVWGIELDPEAAAEARTRLDNVLVGDADELVRGMKSSDFRPRLVIFADSLEHMHDPWKVFDSTVELLEPGAHVVVSLPNVAHWDTFANLLRGRWPYRSRGIHDDTHLRFFARRNIIELMNRGPASLVRLERVLRFLERPHPVNRLAPLLCRWFPGPFTYQYLAVSVIREQRHRSG
jgi:SAM-dependent methyltransferase